MNRWATATYGLCHRPSHHPGLFEGIEVLPQGGIRQSELGGEIGGCCGFHALQPFHDPALGIGLLGHRANSTRVTSISEALPCIIEMRGISDVFDKMFRS